MAPGSRPTGMLASTRLVAASILVTVSSRLLETQTDPAARAMPVAWRPTGTVATLRLVAGSDLAIQDLVGDLRQGDPDRSRRNPLEGGAGGVDLGLGGAAGLGEGG